MKLTLLSLFLYCVAAHGLSIRSNKAQQQSQDYLVTAPKIFSGQESVCVHFLDQENYPSDATVSLELKTAAGKVLFEKSEPLEQRKSKVFRLNLLFIFKNLEQSRNACECRWKTSTTITLPSN